ncbi:hypothetical protein EV702DRAFT_1129175 [Suillus placidus]|uniref:Uncharacterized protein n=1 Tax=Suillus placidus TaxID=48579 RepID=A0A9P6ZQ79_9AGAM|nr:hypothetical protein EV702DRAFT_1129175 [Suillus placidus]
MFMMFPMYSFFTFVLALRITRRYFQGVVRCLDVVLVYFFHASLYESFQVIRQSHWLCIGTFVLITGTVITLILHRRSPSRDACSDVFRTIV